MSTPKATLWVCGIAQRPTAISAPTTARLHCCRSTIVSTHVTITPVKATYSSGIYRLEYENGAVAVVRIEEKDRYFKFTLDALENRDDIDAVQWGTYHTNITNLFGEIIGVARDTTEQVNYSIGVLALDDNTLGGTADLQGDAAPFQYVIHTPDREKYPLPDNLHEGQIFTLGGDGRNDVAFYSHKEPYYRILYGNAAMVDAKGRISLNYFSRDRTKPREVLYSLIPNMPVNTPNHIEVEPVPGVDYIGSSVAFWGSPDSIALFGCDTGYSETRRFALSHCRRKMDKESFGIQARCVDLRQRVRQHCVVCL